MSIQDCISQLPEVAFPAGERVIAEGAEPGKLFFLKSGRAEVSKNGMRIALLKTPGCVVGEISLLLNSPATASVIAVEDSVFHVEENALEFLRANPEVHLHVSETLAFRLSAATRYLNDVKAQLAECSDHIGLVDGVIDAISHRDLKKKIQV